MKTERQEYFRKLLRERQNELEQISDSARDSAATVELDQTKVGRLSRMDALQGQAMTQAANRRRELALQHITNALQRIDKGDYGYCIDCDEEIAEARLEFDPATTLCIDCASKREG